MGDMNDRQGAPEKGTGAWGQAILAFVLFGVVAGGLWLQDAFAGPGTDSGPATCSTSDDASPAPRKRVSGAQLCAALNRKDLPKLVGTPLEEAEYASGSESESRWASGTKTITPEAKVELESHTVQISASYDDLPVAESMDYLGAGAQSRTVLGHKAVLYSGQTIAISFRLDGGDATSGPGGVARHLLVASDTKDKGDSYDLVIWREDRLPPDDAALFRIAEKVLPTLPGWKSG
ncbi:DUF6215 domain-containing protein [Streptomyces neyagawaensis]|uniref:DUF6215 domain-containing protein n=1 Tax=Streptomyces neyagawaensis TaxID=42238 RepID=UPI003B8A8BF2